ncbi:unnamed protein product [Wuchereria bancrofti]|uniref:Uncharacterized protein n=1 Tax=Wuchereria bancrofti TaxID=6293 RepID=A0A3P7EFP5_WUCBA|nr:unnamed protein product [Wuchereria bancrofti]
MEIDASEDIEDKVEDKPEEPVARRTRSAKRLQIEYLLIFLKNGTVKKLSKGIPHFTTWMYTHAPI